ncbi:hypothetical protein KF947_18625 [Halomonas sp. FeN2]|nr:hypothetical protein KF947_18625 [Halomonas sp. FeN2]
MLAELPKLLPHYVVVLLKEGEHYQLMVLLGERNLYVAPDGKWLGSYATCPPACLVTPLPWPTVNSVYRLGSHGNDLGMRSTPPSY